MTEVVPIAFRELNYVLDWELVYLGNVLTKILSALVTLEAFSQISEDSS